LDLEEKNRALTKEVGGWRLEVGKEAGKPPASALTSDL
jgi:hypothetical protein